MGDSCGSSCASKKSTCGGANAVIAKQDESINRSLGRIKNKILVMSGKGGVGKSTVSTNLAVGLAKRGYKVGLMDVDLHGPDICRMLALTERVQGVEKQGDLVPPMLYGDNLKVISLEYMMENRDDPIIWRGPLKIQAIRQFIADIDWGELDFLVIDSPPGTGDEPLTISSTIKDALALVVTTPQEIALADVRKSLNFCKHVSMEVLGVVENMSGMVCPHCNKTVEIFKTGGGRKTAVDFKVPFLGTIPVDPQIVIGGDAGQPYLVGAGESPAITAFTEVLDNVIASTVNRISLATVTPKCGCEGGECNPVTCDC
ncbi:MAG: Mrp/NBP35 family ATP-binding protein [Proteobacteria bacterium]|nr:Mrp/NBP35 family ATP-binding protein [Pseudomonadota bacterium]MBU1688953.1 Mrp/NBP35 family ATP-binding protein [Pseudomonadota bacterium]